MMDPYLFHFLLDLKIDQQLEAEIVSYAFLIELKDLMGVKVLNPNSVYTILKF